MATKLIKEKKDITEIKQPEHELRMECDFLSAVLSTAGALVVVLDRRGRIVRFNRTCEKLTGYLFEEVKGKPFWDLFLLRNEMNQVKVVFENLRAGGFPNEHENYWLTKSGSRRLIKWSNTALAESDGSVEYVIGTGIDITDTQAAEEKLQDSEKRYRSLLANLDTAVVVHAPDTRILLSNYKAQELLGLSVKTISVFSCSMCAAMVSLRLLLQRLSPSFSRPVANPWCRRSELPGRMLY
jgi:PAS domain S-box-containing protein